MDSDDLLELIDRAAREGWTEIDLRNRELTELPAEIGQLSQLDSLNLGWNELEVLPPEIGHLIRLRKLYLASNRLTVLPPEIGWLTQLQTLSLGGNELQHLPLEIRQLTQLQTLRLSGNDLTALPSKIGHLTQLREVYLRGNQLSELPQEIGRLTQLQYLDLGSNNLQMLPAEIGQLTQLLSLDLKGNSLTALPSQIGELLQLQLLDLGSNRLQALPAEIGQLGRLQSLHLRNNQLAALPEEIGHLNRLRDLDLAENNLTALPPTIGGLSQLISLDLWDNEITTLPSEIGRLKRLEELCLGYDWMMGEDEGNLLVELPPEIGKLTRLKKLDLSGNSLTVLPPQIGQLTRLQVLDLSWNELAGLPSEIARLDNLIELDLRYNPLPLPPEILERTGDPQTIIETCLGFLAGQSQPLNEVKMVLVGQGGVGKTSLVNCLLDGPEAFNAREPKTKGIDVRRWQLPLPTHVEEAQIRVNVWDFGGQEIMHATHQFFLTHRTLYLLVLDTRLSEAENRLDYWLQIIRSFGGESPVILVGNKVDEQPLDIDQAGIRQKYDAIKAIVETSCATGDGIDRLQAAVVEQVLTLPHVFDELLATWFDVKAQLEEMDVDHIPFARYVKMCQEAGVTRESSQRTLLDFLHDLGIVLYFPDPRLETTNVLNPEWVTQGVYRILNSHALFQNDGVLTWDLVGQVLSDEAYPRDKHMFIIDMMRQFELCHPFPGLDHTYLVPDLLPKEERYTGEWDDALTFQIHYDVLPSSVFSRFIVRMHRCIKQHTVWRTGILLALDGNEALVRADLTDNRISILVRGPASGRRDLLTRIREQLDAIHDTIQGLKAEEKVPLPGRPELPPVDYGWLRELEHEGVSEFYPPGLTEPITVGELLNGVEPRVRRERDAKYEIHVHNGGQVGGIGDEHHVDGGVGFGKSSEQT
jgi:internalin A